ncbi:MAG TPA: glycosyltransferase 87 family protein [Gaiellaceae bacterium]|nr:glycosyltransferase 87 family protein [Gaiellaceae bacterium]
MTGRSITEVTTSAPGTAAVVAAAASVVLFLGAWALLHRGFYTHDPIVDTPVYWNYGRAMDDGKAPYRDFALEYPPGALPVFALPAREADDFEEFRVRFEGLMAASGTMMLALVAVALAALGAGRRRLAAALGLVALAPLLLGPVILSRFDLWPAALTAGVLAALVAGRLRFGHVVLGAAVAAKLYPAVLAPLAVAYAWKREGRREGIRCAALLAGTTALVFLPFVVLSPDGVWDSITRQASRPLQIESFGAGLVLAAHHAFGLDITMRSSHGSQNLEGALPDALAVAQTIVQAVVLVAIWVLFARGPATRERLVVASAAALVAFIALGKVLSPQFLIWLLPVVPLLGGRRGLYASGLLAAALVLTQLWFPYRYWDLALRFDEVASWLVVARDALLLGLLALLLVTLRERDPNRLAAGRPA